MAIVGFFFFPSNVWLAVETAQLIANMGNPMIGSARKPMGLMKLVASPAELNLLPTCSGRKDRIANIAITHTTATGAQKKNLGTSTP